MRIGVPKEIKDHEYRVGLVPATVREIVAHGHKVLVERAAGAGIGVRRRALPRPPARRSPARAAEVFDGAEHDRQGQGAAGARAQDAARRARSSSPTSIWRPIRSRPATWSQSGAICIAYETVTDAGRRPAAAGADVAKSPGRMSIQAGAHCLEKAHGGRGVLLGGVPGVAPAKVVILGGGVVGTNAAQMALGMGADVTVLDRASTRCADSGRQFGTPSQHGLLDARRDRATHVRRRRPGHRRRADSRRGRPKLVTRDMVARMKPGAVIVDVAIDQGGCFETSQADDPRRSDLRGRRRRPLLRRQHAGRRCRAPRPSRSTTRRCPSSWRSPTRAGSEALRARPASARRPQRPCRRRSRTQPSRRRWVILSSILSSRWSAPPPNPCRNERAFRLAWSPGLQAGCRPLSPCFRSCSRRVMSRRERRS